MMMHKQKDERLQKKMMNPFKTKIKCLSKELYKMYYDDDHMRNSHNSITVFSLKSAPGAFEIEI